MNYVICRTSWKQVVAGLRREGWKTRWADLEGKYFAVPEFCVRSRDLITPFSRLQFPAFVSKKLKGF